MKQEIIRTDEQINDVLNRCVAAIEDGESTFPGMTYEDGIQAMYLWLVGDTDDHPFD